MLTFITEHSADSVTGQYISENLRKASEELTNFLNQPSCDYNLFHSTLHSARVHLLNAADLIISRPAVEEKQILPQR